MSENQIINSDGVVEFSMHGSPYSPKPRKPKETRTCCGQPNIIQSDLTFGEDGEKIAKPGTVLDLDAMIQAAKASTDIASIVARVKMGDESVLNVSPGFTGDSVNLPKDLYDYKAMNDLYDRVASSYESLPEGLKAAFGSSQAYLNALISNQADQIVKAYNDSQQQQPAEGDNENA